MRILILLFCCALFKNGVGQDSLSTKMLVPDHAIKISPLHLINFYPTIELSYEKKILPTITLQAEAGYVLDRNTGYKSGKFQNKRGVKTKIEVRYYFWGRTDRQKMYYASAEPYLNIVNFDRSEWAVECFDADCNNRYQREYFYKMKYREHGFSIKVGVIRYFFKAFFFDVNSGLTLRNVRYYKPSQPALESGDENDGFPRIPNEADRMTLSPCLGARIGYRIK